MTKNATASPVTGGATRKITSISTRDIIALYAPYTDVTRFFHGITEVDIYECLDTGYRFYHPFTVAGDGMFYENLAKETLYYIPWKWEHDITAEYIQTGDTVRELGCANGDFLLEMMRRKQIKAFGTELNEQARQTAEARGISFTPTQAANVTCAFQVLEHIQDIKGFVGDAVAATKPGGYVIFGIPNNDSFIKDDPTCFLNMPPHHMGLWNEASLRAIAPHFGLEVVAIQKETLQPHHYRYYYQVRFGDQFKRFGLLGKIFNKLVYSTIGWPYVAWRSTHITGHTIMAIYRKV